MARALGREDIPASLEHLFAGTAPAPVMNEDRLFSAARHQFVGVIAAQEIAGAADIARAGFAPERV